MKPLEGIRVIDFTQAHAGSLGTMLLADFGAEVIKVERPNVGDLARYWPPFSGDESGYYAFLNRNKKSITVNARTEEGQEILRQLIKDADVVCENFKVGNMERLNLGYEDLKRINPSIIYASVSGYGITGPMKDLPAYDLMLQAMSGIMDMTGFGEGIPTKVGPAIGDHISGTYMANAVCLALLQKLETGEGQRIDISILDSLCSVLDDTFRLDKEKLDKYQRNGNRDYKSVIGDTFKTKDGFISLNINNEEELNDMFDAFELEGRIDLNSINENDIMEVLSKVFIEKGKFEIEKKLHKIGLSCGAVRSIDEIMNDSSGIFKNIIMELEDRNLGRLKVPSNPIILSDTPYTIENSAPFIGENTKEILKESGMSSEKIEELYRNKIL